MERTLRSAIASTAVDATTPVTIASTQRGHHAAVAIGGTPEGRAVLAVSACLRGLLDAGTRHLVVDLSRVRRLDGALAELLRKVEARLVSQGGVFEMTGLSHRVLHDMDDDPLARVFALYRAAFDAADPIDLFWAGTRCPVGLEDVAEPHTAGRHRSIIDIQGSPDQPGAAGRPRPGRRGPIPGSR